MTNYSEPGRPQQYGQPQYGQPQYGQAQYGQPGVVPAGPGGPGGPGFGSYGAPTPRSKARWIIAGVVVLAVAGIAVALTLSLGGGGSSGGSGAGAVDPTAAVETLLKADVNHDMKTVQDITCDPLRRDLNAYSGDKSYTIGRAVENGDTATVWAKIVNSENDELTIRFGVRKHGGTWKVCDDPVENVPVESGESPAPSDVPRGTDLPSLPTNLPTGTLCVTPEGSSPICIPN